MSTRLSRRDFLKAALVLSSATLAACGGSSATTPASSSSGSTAAAAPTAAAQAPSSPGKKKLIFSSYTWSGYEKAMNSVIDEWLKGHPDVEVERQITGGDDYWTKLQTQIASGTPPDIGIADYARVVSYAKDGVILNIEDMVRSAKFPVDKMMPGAVAQYRWQAGAFDTGEGDLYGLPGDAQSHIMVYNKKLFDAAGVKYPTDDWTWDDIITAGKALTKPSENRYGFTMSPGLFQRGVWLKAAGGSLHTPDYKKSNLLAPETVAAYQWVWDAIHTHKIAPVPGGGGGQQAHPFLSKQVAMAVDGVWWVSDFAAGLKDDEWDVCLFPKHPQTGKRTTTLESDGFWIFKSTKEPELAFDLLQYLTNEAGQKKFDQLNYIIPSCFPDVANSWYSRTPPANRKKIADNIAQDATKVDITYFENQTIYSVVQPVIDQAFADGTDIKAALQQADVQMNAELAKAWQRFNK